MATPPETNARFYHLISCFCRRLQLWRFPSWMLQTQSSSHFLFVDLPSHQQIVEHQQPITSEQAYQDRYLFQACFSSLARQFVEVGWPFQSQAPSL